MATMHPAPHDAARRNVVIAAAFVAAATGAWAQKWSVDAGVGSELTWSSNAELGEAQSRSDTIVNVRPHIRLLGEGARVKVSGTAALSAVAYLNHTQPSRVLPDVDLAANVEAVERFLFIDAGLRARQDSANPFGTRSEAGTTSENSVTTTQGRLSPRVEGTLGSLGRYKLRSENSWTVESGATALNTGNGSEGYFGRHSIVVEREPRPFGWRVEAERSATRPTNAAFDDVILDVARVGVDYAPVEELTLGAHGGRERTNFVTLSDRRNVYGARLEWRPSSGTVLSASQERRFFGTSWRLSFDRRTPRTAWNIASSRTLDTGLQSRFDLAATDNVAGMLDAMFSTRFPDPVERARIVQDFIDRQGLPTSTLRPISLRTQRLSLVRLNSASVGLIGTRSSLTLTGFQTRTEDASDASALVTASTLANNNQHGAALSAAHRLTPLTSITASVDWSRIRALAALGDSQSIQRTARLRVSTSVSRRTTLFTGARFRDLNSTTVPEGREWALVVGLDHRL